MKELFSPDQMDAAADAAMKELSKLPQTCSIPIARWFKDHYLKAGHKRLGRGLVALAKGTMTLPVSQWTNEEDMVILNEEPSKIKPKVVKKAVGGAS